MKAVVNNMPVYQQESPARTFSLTTPCFASKQLLSRPYSGVAQQEQTWQYVNLSIFYPYGPEPPTICAQCLLLALTYLSRIYFGVSGAPVFVASKWRRTAAKLRIRHLVLG